MLTEEHIPVCAATEDPYNSWNLDFPQKSKMLLGKTIES